MAGYAAILIRHQFEHAELLADPEIDIEIRRFAFAGGLAETNQILSKHVIALR